MKSYFKNFSIALCVLSTYTLNPVFINNMPVSAENLSEISSSANTENYIYSDDNGLLNIDYDLFGKSFDEINDIFNSELDEPQDFPYWGLNFKNVDYTYNDIPVCFMFQYDKLVAITYDRLSDFDETTYNAAVDLFGEDTDNVWYLDNCSFSLSTEPYENGDYYFRQTYLSYDTIDENCIYSDDNGLLNINYSLFGKSFDEINDIFNSELDEPQDFPYWGLNFKNVDYTYNDIPVCFMFQYDKLVAITYDRLSDFDETTYNAAVDLFGEDTDNVWYLDNCSFSLSTEPYENGDYYFRQTYLSYDTIDTLTGDVTKDGDIDILDVVLLKRYIVNLEELDEISYANADTVQDGTIDVKDLGQLIKYIIKVIDTFDV